MASKKGAKKGAKKAATLPPGAVARKASQTKGNKPGTFTGAAGGKKPTSPNAAADKKHNAAAEDKSSSLLDALGYGVYVAADGEKEHECNLAARKKLWTAAYGEGNKHTKDSMHLHELENILNDNSCGTCLNWHNPDMDLMTPLIAAARYNKHEAVRLLIDKGAWHAESDQKGDQAIHWAAIKGHAVVIRLLSEIMNVDEKSKKTGAKLTGLQWSAAQGHTAAVQAFIECKASLDLQDEDKGWTAMHWAIQNEKNGKFAEEVVKQLWEAGANVNIKDKKGDTPYTLAGKKKRSEVVAFFRRRSPSLTAAPAAPAAELSPEELKQLKPAEVDARKKALAVVNSDSKVQSLLARYVDKPPPSRFTFCAFISHAQGESQDMCFTISKELEHACEVKTWYDKDPKVEPTALGMAEFSFVGVCRKCLALEVERHIEAMLPSK